jgi:hypothetical protein
LAQLLRRLIGRGKGLAAKRKESGMEYLLMIYSDPNGHDSPELLAGYGAFSQEVAQKGVLRGGNRLRRAPEARTVSVRNGKTLTTDGPYAETKEQLGGYYLLDCKSFEEALEFASKIPNAKDGFIEVRPVWPMGE